MKLIATTISDTSVHMRYADSHDPTQATQWIDFQVPLESLKHPTSQVPMPLGDPDLQFVGEVRQAALRYTREAIGDETQRLANLAGHNRR